MSRPSAASRAVHVDPHRRGGPGSRLGPAVTGALATRAVLGALRGAPSAPLHRSNYRGREVTLAGGVALATGGSLGAALGAASAGAALGLDGARLSGATLLAGLGAGAVGLYDDVVGARADQKAAKGFRGHLGSLRDGRVTSGLVKIVGVGAAAVAASALLGAAPARAGARRRAGRGSLTHVLLGAGVIAGTANLLNLLDLRPGRALKAGAAIGGPLLAGPRAGLVRGPLGAAAAIAGDDLGERVMLGDCGANALGALLGVALAARTGPAARIGLLVPLLGLTAASEKISFTRVIERTPGLRELDALGRRAG